MILFNVVYIFTMWNNCIQTIIFLIKSGLPIAVCLCLLYFLLFLDKSPFFVGGKVQLICSFIGLFPHSWLCNSIQVTFIIWNWAPSAIKHWFIRAYCLFAHSCPSLGFFFKHFDRENGVDFPAWTQGVSTVLQPKIKPTTWSPLFSFQVCVHMVFH